MATTNQNRLLTSEVKAAFEGRELYSQDGKKKDAKCIAVFRIGNIRWYFIEGQEEGEDFIFYGVVLGLVATEYGYVSANEMASITIDASKYGLGILQVEQDEEFEPCKLSAIKDAELQWMKVLKQIAMIVSAFFCRQESHVSTEWNPSDTQSYCK